jgi:hypothetical protein
MSGESQNDELPGGELSRPGEREWAALEWALHGRAMAGSNYAAWICLQMKIAEAKLVAIELPTVEDATGLDRAQAALMAALGRRLSPQHAVACSRLLENRRRSLTSRDLEARLMSLEEENRRRDREAFRAEA